MFQASQIRKMLQQVPLAIEQDRLEKLARHRRRSHTIAAEVANLFAHRADPEQLVTVADLFEDWIGVIFNRDTVDFVAQ